MPKTIGQTLVRLRGERGLSQRELAELLSAQGVHVSNQAISKWETDATQPNATQFLALLRVFRVRDALSVFTGAPSGDPRDRLNAAGRRKVDDYVQDLLCSGRYDDMPKPVPKLRVLPLYHIAASAGTGQYLDAESYDEIEVGDDVPAQADFGIRLAGDSMEPRFHDGQIVWVKRQQVIQPGQIGIFGLDGSAYCKKLEFIANRAQLSSLNPAYAPIVLPPDAELTCFGRVL